MVEGQGHGETASKNPESSVGRLTALHTLAKTSRMNDGTLFYETNENREKVLREVEHVLFPSLDVGHDVENSLKSLCLLCTPNKTYASNVAKLEHTGSAEFSRRLTRLILRNIHVVVALIHEEKNVSEVVWALLEILDRAHELGTYAPVEHEVESVVHNVIAVVRTKYGSGGIQPNPNVSRDIASLALSYGPQVQRKQALDEFLNMMFVANGRWLNYVDEYIQRAVDADKENPQKLTDASRENLAPLFKKMGISMGAFLLSWRDSCAGDSYDVFVKKNLDSMISIEGEYSGAVRWLARERGIRAFCRYSTSLLAEQYKKGDEYKSHVRAPVVIVTSQHDFLESGHASSALDDADEFIYDTYDLFSELENPPPLILLEANNSYALWSRLHKIANTIPETAKGKTVLIFNAHGDATGLQLSNIGRAPHRQNVLTRSMARLKKQRHRVPQFKNGVVSILASCDTGKGRESFGDTFTPFGKVFAPVAPVSGSPTIEVKDTENGAEVRKVIMKDRGKEVHVRKLKSKSRA